LVNRSIGVNPNYRRHLIHNSAAGADRRPRLCDEVRSDNCSLGRQRSYRLRRQSGSAETCKMPSASEPSEVRQRPVEEGASRINFGPWQLHTSAGSFTVSLVASIPYATSALTRQSSLVQFPTKRRCRQEAHRQPQPRSAFQWMARLLQTACSSPSPRGSGWSLVRQGGSNANLVRCESATTGAVCVKLPHPQELRLTLSEFRPTHTVEPPPEAENCCPCPLPTHIPVPA